jgi:AcrR family transcriptional regulator
LRTVQLCTPRTFQYASRVSEGSPDQDCPSGLRERKKLATRQALIRAAVRLAVERGVENVRIEDIAAAAGVSPRTYHNYFPSREAAICALRADQGRRIGAALLARPADEPLPAAITHAMLEQYADGREPMREVVRLVGQNPVLLGEFLKAGMALERELAAAIAERSGTDAERDLFPQILAAAVSGAMRVATQCWMQPEVTTPYAALLRAALEQAVRAAAAPTRPHHDRIPVPPTSTHPSRQSAC